MNPEAVSLPLAFVAGLLSFLSPCVLPLVPAYVGYLGGTAVLGEQRAGARTVAVEPLLHALFFVLGFAAVFVALGASATVVGRVFLTYRDLLARVGGVLLVAFGLRMMGSGWRRRGWFIAAAAVALVTLVLDSGLLAEGHIELGEAGLTWLAESLMMGLVVLAGAGWGRNALLLPAAAAGGLNLVAGYGQLLPAIRLARYGDLVLPILASLLIVAATVASNRLDLFYAEKRLELKRRDSGGLGRSFLFGIVFAAGWTPCIGPILTGILLLASQLQTVGQGVMLLVAYSLGLGIPFLVVGLAFGPLSKVLHKLNRYSGAISAVSGGLLALTGLLIFTGSLAFLARYGNFINL